MRLLLSVVLSLVAVPLLCSVTVSYHPCWLAYDKAVLLTDLSREYFNYVVQPCDVYFLNTSLIAMFLLIGLYFATRIYGSLTFGQIVLQLRHVALFALIAVLGFYTLVSERGLEKGKQPSADKPMAYNVFALDVLAAASGFAATEVFCAAFFFWNKAARQSTKV